MERAPSGSVRSTSPLSMVVQAAIIIYQRTVSPILGCSCRFQPSCSQYALEAVRRHGVTRGLLLSLRRLVRCHPWGPAGYDPVPRQMTRMTHQRRRTQGGRSKSNLWTSLPVRFGARTANRDARTQPPASAADYVRRTAPITIHQSHPSTSARHEHEYERFPRYQWKSG